MTRKLPLLTGLTLLVVGSAASARAQTARELFDGLPAQIRAEAEAKRNGKLPQGVGQSDPNYLLSFFRNAREYLDNGDESSATQQLRQMEYAAATDPVRDTCESIITKLRKERTDKETAASAETAAVLQRAGEAILKAKVPKDLDTTLRELAALAEKRVPGRAYERNNDTSSNRLQTVVRFVARWQDYLLSLSRNETRAATEALRSLLSENDSFQSLNIPRSELIGRLPPNPVAVPESTPPPPARRVVSAVEVNAAMEAALDRLKTLDDLAPAIRDLKVFRSETTGNSYGDGNSSSDLSSLLSALQGLQQAYLETQSGVYSIENNAWLNRFDTSNVPRAEGRLIALRARILALTLPRLLGAPETEKPGADERVDAFLERLLAAAKKRGDWQAAARGVEYRRLLTPHPGYDGRSDSNGDEAAFKQFFAGQNFEQAAQYEQAVAAYLSALSGGSREVPVALISERLAAIKKAHPAEYAGGVRANLPPGVADYTAAHRRYRFDAPPAPVAVEDAPAPTPAPTPTPSPTITPTPAPTATPTASPTPSL